jgi:phthiocerol/phthiodiolone dimycocerosyl transferase-like enzyme
VTTQLCRPLSPQERWYWIANQLSPLNVISRLRVHGKISHDLLEAAAAALAAEYPVLRVAITAEADGTNPSYLPSTRPIGIRTLTGDDVEWQRQVDSYELATSLDWHTGPLVRLMHIVGNSGDVHDLVLTGSHIAVDGFTVIWLIIRLLQHADRLSRSPGDTQTISRPAVGASEDLLPARYRGVRGFARIASSVVADGLVTAITRPRRLRPETPVPPSQRRTRLLCRNLSGSQLDALIRRCHAEGVTVHGALAAAMAMAIGPVAAQKDSGWIAINSPVDCRVAAVPPVPFDEAGRALRRWPGSMVDRPAGQPVDASTHAIRSASRSAERCAVRSSRLARQQRARHWPVGTSRCYPYHCPDERRSPRLPPSADRRMVPVRRPGRG